MEKIVSLSASASSSTQASIIMNSRRESLKFRSRSRRNFIFVAWTLIFLVFSFTAEQGIYSEQLNSSSTFTYASNEGRPTTNNPSSVLLSRAESWSTNNPDSAFRRLEEKLDSEYEIPGVNCTPPGIDDFPADIFTMQQRQQGFLIVHFLASLYIFYALAIVCDDYFVPSMECICEGLKMPSDIAGATFMAVATSAPELFTNIIGTFITKGDIGIGTIVGSAVFNILAVVAVCGIFAGMLVPLEWWSVTRDCLFYSLSVILLIAVLRDERIYWYEALVLVSVYLVYILGMYKNRYLKKRAEKIVNYIQRSLRSGKVEPSYEITPMDSEAQRKSVTNGVVLPSVVSDSMEKADEDDEEEEFERQRRDHKLVEVKAATAEAEEEADEFALCKLPIGYGCRIWTEWIVGWLIRAVYKITVPDCRQERWKKFYMLTFLMCIIWIGVLSYIVNWMMTIIGHTLKIPDSVMGLTFIAAGTSIPEVVSSLIVSRQGLGTMALSNSIGSNTFDILMCLGLPWLIRTSIIAQDSVNYIKINSIGLEYSAMMLITSLLFLYIILSCNKYVLDRKVGFISLGLYCLFLTMATLFELNVFFTVNLPTCVHPDHQD